MSGWIKLHRDILNHWLYNEYRPLTKREAWENILLWANFKDDKCLIKGNLVECKRGQLIYSLETYAEKFCWTVGQVRSFFNLLKNDNMITVEGLKYTTRLTVCNYDNYQSLQHSDNILTTDSQHSDNILTTDSQQQEKKVNKVNKEKKEKNSVTRTRNEFLISPFLADYVNVNWKILIEMPKWRKKEDSAIEASIKKLKLFDDEYKNVLITNAIAGEYQGVVFADSEAKYQEWKNKGAPKQTYQQPQKSQSCEVPIPQVDWAEEARKIKEEKMARIKAEKNI